MSFESLTQPLLKYIYYKKTWLVFLARKASMAFILKMMDQSLKMNDEILKMND